MSAPREFAMPFHPSIRSPVRLSLAAAITVAAAAVSASAQFRLRPMGSQGFNGDPTPDGQAHDGTDSPVGVTVPDSPGATERLAHGAEKEQQKQWKVAADFYREAVTQFAGRVVPAASAPAKGTAGMYRFTGVASAVQERIAKWPPEGLAVYRNLYGPAAADRLAAAGRGDLATLGSIFFDDFVTDAGKAAGLRLIDAYAEAGDFPAAAAIGDRLLDLHPLLGSDRPTILFRTALADHWAGDDAAANRRLADLRQSDATAVGSVGGKDVVLADALAAAIAVPPPVPAVDPIAADTYPSFGGPGGRGDVSASTARPGASRNTVALVPPDFSTLGGAQRTNGEAADKVSLDNGGARGIMPVVDAGTLFFQDGRTVYAVDADSGMPVTAWLGTYPGEAGGRYHLPTPVPGRARGEELTITVTPTAVLAVMGQRDRGLAANGTFNGGGFPQQVADGSPSTVRLVCLDRATGRELWKASPAELPDAAAAVKGAEYDGTPLSLPAAVAGTGPGTGGGAGGGADDAVLVVARGRRDGQFDNCYVVCLSARTGQYRWSTYIGSGNRISSDGETVFGSDPSQLALADGRVLVMSNLGTVAALDPADGRVEWLDAYPRDNTESLQDAMNRQQVGNGGPAGNNRPWAPNPVVVQGGHVFALPTDAKELFVLDAATGRQVRRIETKDYDGADVLLGVHDEPRAGGGGAEQTVILTADKRVWGVDWQAYDPDRPTAAIRFNELTEYDSDATAASNTSVAGRGFLTADAIFVTTNRQLFQFGWRRGHVRLQAVYPSNGSFSGGQGPGNVLVTSQNVVVAGQDRVDVYTDLAVVTAKYDAEMRTAPADPEPRVRFATALFAGGQTADALARMDEAIALVGGRRSMRPGPGRQMVFNVLLDFARRVSQPVPKDQAADPKMVELGDALFDRAADAADGPEQRVAYLLARGRFEHDVAHGYAAEVELCQQVLSDPALRAVAVTDEETAAAVASAAIGSAVALDRSAYAPVEARAAAALVDARGKGDPDGLLSVAEVYPNSRAAVDARRGAVDLFQSTGRPAEAIGVLRQMYAAAGDPVVKAGVLELIAADFLATGPDGVGPAADRLAAAAQLSKVNPMLASDLKLPDGTVLRGGVGTYGDAVAALRVTLAAAEAARLPDFRLATQAQAEARFAAAHGGDQRVDASKGEQLNPFVPGVVIPGVTALVTQAQGFDRNDRVVTWSSAGLAVYEVGQATPRFRAAEVADEPAGVAWVRGHDPASGRWVAWSSTGVTALTDDGRPAWPAAVAMRDLSAVPAVAGTTGAVVDEPPAGTDQDAVQQQQMVVVNGQVMNVRVMGGGRRVLVLRGNRVNPAPVAPPPVALSGGEQVVAVQPAGDVLLVTTSSGRLVAIDAAGGKVVWQARPADRPIDALLANAHFTVARLSDPAAGDAIVVYDTPTGRVIGRRNYAPENQGQGVQLVNVALGEEGTLALTLAGTANGLQVKDLYDPWKLPPTPLTAQGNPDAAGYVGMTQPDQLLVRAGRVVALYDSGRFARAYDTSRPGDPTNPLRTASSSPNVWLRMEGPRLFVIQPAALFQYNLADPADTWTQPFQVDEQAPRIAGVLFGSDHVIAVHDPVAHGPAPSPSVTFLAVSRAAVPGTMRTSGSLDFVYRAASASGVSGYAAVDGGVCVLLGNHRLVELRGGRDAGP